MLNKFKVKKGIKSTAQSGNDYEPIPPGIVIMHSSTTIPDGWLLCDGSSYSKSLYPNLNSVLSLSSYPFGSTSTDFFVPNLVGTLPIAAGSAVGFTTRTVGASGGAYYPVLSSNNVPAHQHGLNNHTHASLNFGNSGDHTHNNALSNTGNVNADHGHSRPNHAHGWQFSANTGSGTAISTMRASGTAQNAGIGAGNNATSGTLLSGFIFGPYWHTHNWSGNTGNQSATHTHNLTTDTNTVVSAERTSFTIQGFDGQNPSLTISFIIKY